MNSDKSRRFGLEERTFKFASQVRLLIKELPKTSGNFKDGDQLIRSSGSVAANFIESVESISQKDKVFRLKICRKEAKESNLWLRLIDTEGRLDIEQKRLGLAKESLELTSIFGSIIKKLGV